MTPPPVTHNSSTKSKDAKMVEFLKKKKKFKSLLLKIIRTSKNRQTGEWIKEVMKSCIRK
jgi:hypothetical protein